MQTLESAYKGFSLVLELNWDRMLYVATLAMALLLGAYLATL